MTKFLYALLVVVFAFSPNYAQDSIKQPVIADTLGYSLNSPYQTVLTHLQYLQPDTYHPEIAAKTFNLEDRAAAKKLAVQLKQILDGKGLYVDLDVIPRENNYADSITGLKRYVLFNDNPEIYVEKVDNKWYYSRRTANAISELHQKIYPFGSDFLINLMPTVGSKKVLGLQVWQHAGILLLILITLVLHKLFTLLIGFTIRKLAKRISVPVDHLEVVRKVAKAISLLLLTLLLVLFVPVLQLPITSAKYVVLFLGALTPFFGMLAFYHAVDLLSAYMEKQAEKTATSLDDQLIPLVRKSLKIFIFIIGILFILHNLNFNVTTLLAGISIGGLAFALAAQDTVKNLFGSLMIFVDRPFQIGDWIKFAGSDGTVEEVGFRSTRVRTFDNSLVSVPNGEIANMVVDNFGLRVYRRYKTYISITYDTPPDLIEKFVEGLKDMVAKHPQTRKDNFHIYMNEMNSASLDILFYIFFEVPGWGDELKARHDIIIGVLRLAEELGVRFAFPTQTIHIEEFPEKKSTTPTYDTNPENMNKKIAGFLARYKN